MNLLATKFNYRAYYDLNTPEYLSWEFYEPYIIKEPDFGPIGLIVYLRTYSRFIPELHRREKWCETVLRVVEYSISLYNGPTTKEELTKEAEELFDYIFTLKVFPAGRCLWVGKKGNANPVNLYNCSFRAINSIDAWVEIFYLLLAGAGTGFSVEEKYLNNLPVFNPYIRVRHESYDPIESKSRKEFTEITAFKMDSKFESPLRYIEYTLTEKDLIEPAEKLLKGLEIDKRYTLFIEVGDSKVGWCTALAIYLQALTQNNIFSISFNYDNVRPAGEPLKTTGGRASGYLPLKLMFRKVAWVINNCNGILSSVDAMDISNFIAELVVVAGVRRSSQIAIGDADDQAFIEAKQNLWNYVENLHGEEGVIPYLEKAFSDNGYDIWSLEPKVVNIIKVIDKLDPKYRYRSSRVMSNNSIALYSKPAQEQMDKYFEIIRNNGEPGLINFETGLKRRSDFKGVNPCAEILCDNYTLCNLSEVPLPMFCNPDGTFDMTGYTKALYLATRNCSRITNVQVWHPAWDEVQKRDRLLGVSLTGQCDAWDILGWDHNGEEVLTLLNISRELIRYFADQYHREMDIPLSKLATCVKPSGTISTLVGVSSGVHRSYAPYFYRRIRVSSSDPVARVLRELEIPCAPENGQGTDLDSPDANTWVFTFAVKSDAISKSIDEPALAQLERYKATMTQFVEHNTSCTISCAENEWDDCSKWLLEKDNWNNFVGVSFLPRFDPSVGDSPYPQLPYETIDEKEYKKVKALLPELKEEEFIELISKYESYPEEYELESSCGPGGACPVR